MVCNGCDFTLRAFILLITSRQLLTDALMNHGVLNTFNPLCASGSTMGPPIKCIIPRGQVSVDWNHRFACCLVGVGGHAANDFSLALL